MNKRLRQCFLLFLCSIGLVFGHRGVMKAGEEKTPLPVTKAGTPEKVKKVEPPKKPADSEIDKLRKELAATQKALAEAKQEHQKSEREKSAAESKLADHAKTVESLRKELATEKTRHKNALSKLDAVKKDVATAKAELDEAKRDLAKYQAELTASAKSRANLAKQLEEEKSQAKSAATRLAEGEKTLAKTQKELGANQKLLLETKTVADRLSKSLDKEKDQHKAIAAKLAESNAAMLKAEEALNKTRAELSDATKARSLLGEQLKLEKLQAKTLSSKLSVAVKEGAQTKTALLAAQKVLAAQPPAPASIVVTLPADAQLKFNDYLTYSIGDRRVYQSPALIVGQMYYYTLNAELIREGKTVTLKKEIEVQAGQQTDVNLQLPSVSGK